MKYVRVEKRKTKNDKNKGKKSNRKGIKLCIKERKMIRIR